LNGRARGGWPGAEPHGAGPGGGGGCCGPGGIPALPRFAARSDMAVPSPVTINAPHYRRYDQHRHRGAGAGCARHVVSTTQAVTDGSSPSDHLDIDAMIVLAATGLLRLHPTDATVFAALMIVFYIAVRRWCASVVTPKSCPC